MPILANMPTVQQALATLMDERQGLAARVNAAGEVKGLGIAKLSAMLQVAYPEKYGVWNAVSRGALEHLGLWPQFPRGATLGEQYVLVNRVLLDLARAADVDLWTLDALLWGIDAPRSTAQGTARTSGRSGGGLNVLSDERKAAIAMRYSIEQTVKYSNGQQELQRVKNKELRLSATELESLLERLLVEQGGRCALTGLPLEYNGDAAFRPSPDRIDSDGHYEAGNIQVVCWFANRWKGTDTNEEFARLLAAVRAPAAKFEG